MIRSGAIRMLTKACRVATDSSAVSALNPIEFGDIPGTYFDRYCSQAELLGCPDPVAIESQTKCVRASRPDHPRFHNEALDVSLTTVSPSSPEPDEPNGYSTSALQRWRARTDGPLLVIAIGSLPLLLLEFDRPTLTGSDRIFLDTINVVVLAAFAIDYVVELVLAAADRCTSARSGPAW